MRSGDNTWSGPIILDTNAAIGAATGTIFSIDGLISDAAGGRDLTKEGGGEVRFTRVGGNTYRGLTTINHGVLTITDPLSLGAPLVPAKSIVLSLNEVCSRSFRAPRTWK